MASLSDDEMADLMLTCATDAHRLATWLLRDPVAAEDAVQEAALAAWKARGSLKSADNLPGWFATIVANVCRDELRRRSRRRALPVVEPVASAADRQAERDEIGRAIGRLTPDEQMTIGLRFGRDLTVPQIAELLKVPVGTAKSRLHHSLEHLRSELAAERRQLEPES